MKRAGTFITLEGVEGVGKSTHMGFIAKQIERSGVRAVMTREPGGTRLGEVVREILLHGQELDIFPETELLLMFAARSQHLEEVILPALAEGSVVICDRFTDASYAYQGGGRKIPESLIQTLEQSVQHDLRPDLTLLFDASVETGLKRAGRRSNADRFEAEDISFFNRVRETYLARAKADPGRIKIIDAEQDIVGVERQILSILESWL